MIAVMAVATLIAEGIVTRSTLSPRHCSATASCRVHRRRSDFLHTSLQKFETHVEVGLVLPPSSFRVTVVVVLSWFPEGRHKSGKQSRVATSLAPTSSYQPFRLSSRQLPAG